MTWTGYRKARKIAIPCYRSIFVRVNHEPHTIPTSELYVDCRVFVVSPWVEANACRATILGLLHILNGTGRHFNHLVVWSVLDHLRHLLFPLLLVLLLRLGCRHGFLDLVTWFLWLGLEFAVWADKANAVTAALCCHTWSTLCHVQSCCVTLRFVVVVVVVVVFVRFTADKLVDMLKNVTILIQGKNLMWFKKWNI